MNSAASAGDPDRLSYLLNIEEGVTDAPEQPEALAILRRLRRFNLPMWSGGYADQPSILMMELNTVIETEIEMENIHTVNALRVLKTKQDQEQKDAEEG